MSLQSFTEHQAFLETYLVCVEPPAGLPFTSTSTVAHESDLPVFLEVRVPVT